MHALPIEPILAAIAVLLLVGVIASKASSTTGVPSLLLFLAIGMLAGSEGIGRIAFDNPGQVQFIGVVALAFILFSGGLDTSWGAIKPVLARGLILANIGVLISAAVMAVAAVWVLGFTPLEGFLLGAIVSSTDAAAVFAVMRARNVNLKNGLEALIEFESGSNDPIAVFLTIGLTEILAHDGGSLWSLIPSFALQMAVGAAMGYGLGRAGVFLINRMRLNQEGLYPVLTIGLVLLTYSLTALLRGNGFLAVYLAGIVMNGLNFVHKRSLMRFHDGLAWLMQIAMFIVLGLQVFPSQLLPLAGQGLILAAVLIFLARPISVFLALIWFRMSIPALLTVSWVGLRGAVPIVMATFPMLAGLPQANLIFNIVFFIVLSSVLLQGTTIPIVARWLGTQYARHTEWHYPQEFVPQVSASSKLMEVLITPESNAVNRSIMELNMPAGVLVVSISRDGDTIVPSGATVLESGDRMLVLANRELLPLVREVVLRPRMV
jgi:potassium/hydrogen antiporter